MRIVPLRSLLRSLPLLLWIFAPVAMLRAQAASPAVLEFHFERPGVAVPAYSFTVQEDGTGTYLATYAEEGTHSSQRSTSVAPESKHQVTQPLALSLKTTAKLFEQVRSTERFRAGCASKAKNVADTGVKTLRYKGAEGEASCTYNYTENKTIAELTGTFQGMAFTLEAAQRLQFNRRFDRLGLDKEMGVLVDAARDGRALEMSNIAPVLRALVNDNQLLERVRLRAARLLEQGSSLP